MGKRSSAPKPPDPRETSAAQTATNVGTAIANNAMGMVDQYTPEGSLTHQQTGTTQWHDPYTGKTYNIPTYSATTELSPEAQGIYDTNLETQQNLATVGADQSAFLEDYMSQPFQYEAGDHEAWATGLYDDLNREGIERDRAALDTRLVNQGLTPGSEAYDAAMGNLLDSQGDARSRFLLDSFNTGFSTAQAQRNQPINEITALLSGSQVSQPNVALAGSSRIPTTDVAGLIGQNYNQRYANWADEQERRGSMLGGLFGTGATILSGGLF